MRRIGWTQLIDHAVMAMRLRPFESFEESANLPFRRHWRIPQLCGVFGPAYRGYLSDVIYIITQGDRSLTITGSTARQTPLQERERAWMWLLFSTLDGLENNETFDLG